MQNTECKLSMWFVWTQILNNDSPPLSMSMNNNTFYSADTCKQYGICTRYLHQLSKTSTLKY